MLRSLYSSISGLRNHQVALDVTANNIANVNTIGFKAGRVTFEESMSQLLKGSSRPPGNAGGTNPMQVGLGMSVGSIDTILSQGNLQSTGQITDLALEGRAYFAFSDGESRYYSRNGALQMDSNGSLVSPTNGFTLQGIMADLDGTYSPGTPISSIRVPYGEKAPANATTEVGFACNLDSDSEALGTVIHTNRFLATATGNSGTATPDLLTSLFDSSGNTLGIREGDVLTISATDGADGTVYTLDYSVTSSSTIQDLNDQIATFIGGNITNGSGALVTVDDTTGFINVDLTGVAGAVDINGLVVRSDRPGSNSYVSNLFSWGPSITDLASWASSDAARAPAESTDYLVSLFDSAGNSLDLEDETSTGGTADVITINGAVGGNNITPVTLTIDGDIAGGTATSVQDLLDEIRGAFNLPNTMNIGTATYNSSDINGVADNNLAPLGSITIYGQPEGAFSLTNVSVTASNSDNDQTAPTEFTSNSIMTEIQSARDTGVHATSITVYDESGDSHVITTTFTHSGTPGEWLWEITLSGDEQIISGNMGRMYFGQDGSVSAFTFDDATTSFRFNPMNGSNEVQISLGVGGPTDFTGITQFRSPTTTAARDQDGYPMGKLSEISIDEFGEISGIYSNGVSKAIARIMLAEFNNPAGLLKKGDSMYSVSNNSGEGVLLQAGVGTSTKVKPGALEMSNVELAQEFTTMITTQRGYQANARVITTSDQMLQELVQLIR